MNQTEQCATKRVFGVMIWYNNVVGKRLLDFFAGSVFSLVAGLSYVLIVILLQELIAFPCRLQYRFIVRPWVYYDESAN